MQVPTLAGTIDRRILINYRIDPAVAARNLPSVFRPKLVKGQAIGGVCLIRLKHIRPVWLPLPVGIGSENAAHRFAVEWDTPEGPREGVYIPRRDSSSMLNTWVGGRLFPGIHHHARFNVNEQDDRYDVAFESDDGQASIAVRTQVDDKLPVGSIFASLDQASAFFESGSLGYSQTREPDRFDGLNLDCAGWSVTPLRVLHNQSSFFNNPEHFPPGSVALDHALLMRDIPHRWSASKPLSCSISATD